MQVERKLPVLDEKRVQLGHQLLSRILEVRNGPYDGDVGHRILRQTKNLLRLVRQERQDRVHRHEDLLDESSSVLRGEDGSPVTGPQLLPRQLTS